MLKALIVDDERMSREALKYLISGSPELELMGEFEKPVAAANFLESNSVDILFLDVNMPVMNGLELIRSVKPHASVVLVTSDPTVGPDAFELNVKDYLLKPIGKERFEACIKRIKDDSDPTAVISIRSDGSWVRLPESEILAISVVGDYLKFYHKDQRTFLTHSSLKQMMEKLSDNFIQIHQSHVVNKNHLTNFNSSVVKVSNLELPVSRSKRQLLNQIVAD